jgi:hypothetical protein
MLHFKKRRLNKKKFVIKLYFFKNQETKKILETEKIKINNRLDIVI